MKTLAHQLKQNIEGYVARPCAKATKRNAEISSHQKIVIRLSASDMLDLRRDSEIDGGKRVGAH